MDRREETVLVNLYAIGAVSVLAAAALAGSNFAYDRGIPRSITRYLASVLGGFAFLASVLWLDVWTTVTVAGVISVLILVLRLGFRRGLRGVEGNRPSQTQTEVTYVLAGTLSLTLGWGLLGDKWLAFLPIAFMAWGDSTCGLARATHWRGNMESVGLLLIMLGVCLAAAALFQPYWIGAIGGGVAVAAERRRPMVLSFWDDNMNVVAVSIAVMGAVAWING